MLLMSGHERFWSTPDGTVAAFPLIRCGRIREYRCHARPTVSTITA